MRCSIITVAGLSAIVLASPNPIEKRQYLTGSQLSSAISKISSLVSELQPPPSISAQLTGVPAAVATALYDPAAISSLQAEILASGFPAWYTSLSPDAQSYIIGVAGKVATIVPQIISLEVAAGLTTLPGAAAGTGVSTAPKTTATGSSNTTVTTKALSSTASVTGSGATTKAASSTSASTKASSSSSSGGAAPTGAIAAGVIGAVGFLGFALAL